MKLLMLVGDWNSSSIRRTASATAYADRLTTRRRWLPGIQHKVGITPGSAEYLLPYRRAGTRDVVAHVRDEQTNDMIGYFGDDPGDPVIVPAGSVACFSSTVFHGSGHNTTDHVRRAYVARYTAQPLLRDDGSRPRHLAEPVLVAGEPVRHPELHDNPRRPAPWTADPTSPGSAEALPW